MRLLERYVLGEHLLPFLLGFGVVTLVIIFDLLFDLLDLIFGKGIPPLIVGRLFLLALGWITVLSIPCGVLVACLMTFGRMAQDNEITALRSCGVPMTRVLLPVLAGALVVAGGLGLFNNYVLPETNHAYATLNLAIRRKAPTAVIREGVFNDEFPDKSLLVGSVNNRTGELKDITIYDYSSGDIPVTILARTGSLRYSADGTTLRLDLRDGEIHEVPADGDVRKYWRVHFKNHAILLRNAGAALEIPERDSRTERELGIGGLNTEIRRLNGSARTREARLSAELDSLGFPDYATFARRALPPPKPPTAWIDKAGAFVAGLFAPRDVGPRVELPENDRERIQVLNNDLLMLRKKINSYSVEVHKKISIPFACIVFVLLGVPVGLRARRGGIGSVAIAVGFILVYYMLLIGGEQLADRTVLPPALAMWTPNIVLGIPGLWLTWRTLVGREERR